jgi:DNA-binding response OmpR family regulator
MLPGISGFDVVSRLRAGENRVPVLLLTARDAPGDIVRGLDLGADDYLTKPFSYAVLLARLRALVRRGGRERPTVLEAGDLRLDPAQRRAWRAEHALGLTTRELALLEYLLRHKGDVVSKRDILEHVWDYDFEGDPNIVEVYIRRLRNKLDRPFAREAIETIRGAGYRLVPDGG